jgi:colicin import membrane protein
MTGDHDIEVLTERGDDLVSQARYQDAVKPFEKATKLLEERRGRLDESTLNSRERLADTLMSAGDLAGATDCHLEIVKRTLENLRQYQSLRRPENGVISAAQKRHLDAQRRLADTYLIDRNYGKAISTYQAIVDTEARKSLEDVIKDRVDLASALFESSSDRNIMEAVNLNIETLHRAEQSLGRSHIETAKVRFNLAKELFILKKYNDAATRCVELLDILQAGRYRGGEEFDHLECLRDTKKLLKNCSARIALQEEDTRRQIAQEKKTAMEKEKAKVERQAAEARRRAAEQVREGKEIRKQVDKGIEAIKKATENEWKGKERSDPKGRSQDPPVTWKKDSQARNFDDSARTTRGSPNSGGRETKGEVNSQRQSDIRKKAPSPTDSSRASPTPDKRTSDTPKSPARSPSKAESVSDRPRMKDTPKDSSARSLRTEPPKHRRSASVVSQPSGLTGENLKELDRKNSSFDRLRSKDLLKSSLATESKTEPPTRPRSASATIHSSDRTEQRPKQSERRNSSRSEVIERSQSATPDKGRRPPSAASRYSDRTGKKVIELERVSSIRSDKSRTTPLDRKGEGKTEAKKAQAPSKPEGTVVIQDKKRERGDDKEKAGSDSSTAWRPQTPDDSARASRRGSVDGERRDSDSLKTLVGRSKRRSEQLSPTSETNERQDSEPKVTSNRARPRDERVSRTVSAPSITVTEPAPSRHAAKRKQDQEQPIVDVEAPIKTERERPKSSQSNYEVASSTSDTARKRQSRSASTGSRKAEEKRREQDEDAKKPAQAGEMITQQEGKEAKKIWVRLDKEEERQQEEAAEEARRKQEIEAKRIHVREAREKRRKEKELAEQAAEAVRRTEASKVEKNRRNDEAQKQVGEPSKKCQEVENTETQEHNQGASKQTATGPLNDEPTQDHVNVGRATRQKLEEEPFSKTRSNTPKKQPRESLPRKDQKEEHPKAEDENLNKTLVDTFETQRQSNPTREDKKEELTNAISSTVNQRTLPESIGAQPGTINKVSIPVDSAKASPKLSSSADQVTKEQVSEQIPYEKLVSSTSILPSTAVAVKGESSSPLTSAEMRLGKSTAPEGIQNNVPEAYSTQELGDTSTAIKDRITMPKGERCAQTVSSANATHTELSAKTEDPDEPQLPRFVSQAPVLTAHPESVAEPSVRIDNVPAKERIVSTSMSWLGKQGKQFVELLTAIPTAKPALEESPESNIGQIDKVQPSQQSSVAPKTVPELSASMERPEEDNNRLKSKISVETQSQAHMRSESVPTIRTETFKAAAKESSVPGGWHHDFDEPGPVRSLRKVRSNDQLGKGDLPVLQTENAKHKRASSVSAMERSISDMGSAPIKNWSDQE